MAIEYTVRIEASKTESHFETNTDSVGIQTRSPSLTDAVQRAVQRTEAAVNATRVPVAE